MSAPSYGIYRCSVCGMSFDVDRGSPGFLRTPYVCDACWANWRGHDPAPSYDPRAGTAAPVSRIPDENRPVTPRDVRRGPLPPAPTPDQALKQIAPAFDDVLARVDPEEAARQRAARAAAPVPGEVAEPDEQANVPAHLAGPPTKTPGLDAGIAAMAAHAQPPDDRHAPVENVTKGDVDPADAAAHAAAGQEEPQPGEAPRTQQPQAGTAPPEGEGGPRATP